MWRHLNSIYLHSGERGCWDCSNDIPINAIPDDPEEADNVPGFPICIDPTYDTKLSAEDGEATCGICSHNLTWIDPEGPVR